MTELKITGMSCGHCVRAAKQALSEVPGVESVELELDPGIARVTGSAALDDLIAAVREEGYEAAVVA